MLLVNANCIHRPSKQTLGALSTRLMQTAKDSELKVFKTLHNLRGSEQIAQGRAAFLRGEFRRETHKQADRETDRHTDRLIDT